MSIKPDENHFEIKLERLPAASSATYTTCRERAALRCGMGDASVICDLIGAEIFEKFTVRGRLTVEGQKLYVVARRCGDTIWAMRDKIEVPRS